MTFRFTGAFAAFLLGTSWAGAQVPVPPSGTPIAAPPVISAPAPGLPATGPTAGPAVGTAPGVHADDNFKFTTGLEAFNPPIPGSCGRFPAQGDCRVAAFTTPNNAFAAPSSFKLEGYYAFDCLPQFGGGCNGAASWGSSLTGTATLHTSTASAAEPTTLVVVAAGLLAARALGRRRRSV